jgi:hypothetical protein
VVEDELTDQTKRKKRLHKQPQIVGLVF